jgi:ketosteroid isomerase-like protein
MRLRTLAATAGLALALLLPAAPAAAQIDTSQPEGQIRQALRDLRIALASDDIDTALKFYWNDARLTVVDPDDAFKITGWNEWKQYLEDQSRLQKTIYWRRRQPNIHIRGDNAFVTFYVTRQVQRGSTVFKKQERGTYVLKKMNGSWLIVAQHMSALPPILRFQQTK